MSTLRALLTKSPSDTWRMFVALPGIVADWPTHEFGTRQIPDASARAEALAGLGYEIPGGTALDGTPYVLVWDWIEDTDDDGTVVLLASAEVRPL
ncbi:MAG: hypothetical protein HOZ81_13475 [Streptomyces sp.]|nr:hypothetical protein [Streptomyces sp.]